MEKPVLVTIFSHQLTPERASTDLPPCTRLAAAVGSRKTWGCRTRTFGSEDEGLWPSSSVFDHLHEVAGDCLRLGKLAAWFVMTRKHLLKRQNIMVTSSRLSLILFIAFF